MVDESVGLSGIWVVEHMVPLDKKETRGSSTIGPN
jgi:hypothetical protein